MTKLDTQGDPLRDRSPSWATHAGTQDSVAGLDWAELCRHLASQCCFAQNRAAFSQLGSEGPPSPEERNETLALTAEMLRALACAEASFDFVDVPIDEALKSLRLGRTLRPDELLTIRRILEQASRVRTFITTRDSSGAQRRQDFPLLAAQLETLHPDTALAARLTASVDDEGTILDTASPELGQARSDLVAAERRLVSGLENLLRSASIRDALQEPLWMERDGRYVLPVRTDRKSNIDGLTIGVSQSGSTLFIEPTAVAAHRASLDAARRDEQIALHRVLNELTRWCRKSEDSLVACAGTLLQLDGLRGRARFASQLGGIPPGLVDDPTEPAFDLVGARHPLFVLTGKPCVAHDFSFAHNQDQAKCILVLSGPNAGGKTVTMKLLGLFALMAREGLYLPATRARVFCFDKVFAAFGDSQSLQEDLSTFSAHLKTVRDFVAAADNKTLVLLDEGFVGTDPAVGSALARAVLEDLASRRVCTVITTHFSPLKAIADDNSAFLNASMEFEHEALKPTYRLLVGVPGQSYALELATRMGFSAQTIERARELYGKEAGRLEKLLGELQAARTQVDKERSEQIRLRSELERELQSLRAETEHLSQLRSGLVTEYSEKLQKRLNAFRNALEIRERQFFRSRQSLLDALEKQQQRQESKQEPEQGTEQSLPKPSPAPSAKPKDAAPAAQAGIPRKGQTLRDFADLGRLGPVVTGKSATQAVTRQNNQRKWLLGSRYDSQDIDDLIDLNKTYDHEASTEDWLAEAKSLVGQLQDEFDDLDEQLGSHLDQELAKASAPQSRGIKQEPRAPAPVRQAAQPHVSQKPPSPEVFQPGVKVTRAGLAGTGEVLERPSSKGMVSVSFKGMKTRVHFSELKLAETKGTPRPDIKPFRDQHAPRPPQAKTSGSPLARGAILDVLLPPQTVFASRTIDLRGNEVDVALERLDRFVDKALREDMPSFVILHGHGTGAVKKAVRSWLAGLRLACRYRPGTAGEGGDGVTVVVVD